jgi:protein O-GlcNAc transferase
LFNLNGWTAGERTDVFALRPAPIQIQFMGFCSSMGADYIDYLVTDPIASPPECLSKLYSESVIYMPYTYFVNDYAQSCNFVFDKIRPTREQYGLPTDKFIFANFNQLYKIDPNTFTVWMNILTRVPNSVLWLLEYPADAKQNLRKEAKRRGVDPGRIFFSPKVLKNEHINRCYLADLALDNSLTNGHTTSCDLLWSGCPMITYPATENMPSRVAASISCALNCPEMVV